MNICLCTLCRDAILVVNNHMNVKTAPENHSRDPIEVEAPSEASGGSNALKSFAKRIANWIGIVVDSRDATEADYKYLKDEFSKMIEDGSLEKSLDAYSSAVPKH